ncbi:MAG: hypothetical protein CMJ28_06585 [Phycisphaerae bacterium]|nr:hypothetical protein [Phycisphaerae bacterium]
MLWTLLLLNEFDLVFHDDFSSPAPAHEGWTVEGEMVHQDLGLVRPGEQVLLEGKGLKRATLRWLNDKAEVVGEDQWQEGIPSTAPPAARSVGISLFDHETTSNLSVLVSPPAEDRLAGLGNFERSDGGIAEWLAFNHAIAWKGIGREGGGGLRTRGPLNERYGGSGLERRFEIKAGTMLRASVFGKTPIESTVQGSKNFGVLRVECLDKDGRVLEWREVRPVDAEKNIGLDGQWHQASCEIPTPVGSTTGRVVLVFVQPEFETGIIDFDDLVLTTDDGKLQLNESFDGVDHSQNGWQISGDSDYELKSPLSGTAAMSLRSGTILSTPLKIDSTRDATVSLAARGQVHAQLRFPYSKHPPVVLEDTTDAGQGWRSWRTERCHDLPDQAELVIRAKEDVLVDAVRVSQSTAKASTRSLPVLNANLDGQLPNPQDWEIANAEWSFNNEMQFYAQDCVTIQDGVLNLTALNRAAGTRTYSSGHATTKHQHAVKWGRWEVRARLPEGRGYWPAIWLLPTDGSWPPEVDIMEFIGHETNKVHHSAHWGPLRDGLKPWDLGQTSTRTFEGPDFTKEFHNYACEWTPEGVVWFVDGVERHRTTASPRKPMYLILNLAVGGDWPGPPDETTPWGASMEVEHVKIWKWIASKPEKRIKELKWNKRLLVLDANTVKAQELRAEIDRNIASWRDRDMHLVILEGDRVGGEEAEQDAKAWRQKFGLPQEGAVLVGKDGGVKERWPAAPQLQNIFDLVDAMPMRQRELRESSED